MLSGMSQNERAQRRVSMRTTPLVKWFGRERHRRRFRERYTLEATLQRLSSELAVLRDQDSIINQLLDVLVAALDLSGIAYVALPEGLDARLLHAIERGDIRARREYATPRGEELLLGGLRSLAGRQGALTPRSPLLLWPFDGCVAVVLIGPRAVEGVAGLLLIGAKRNGRSLTRSDRALLLTIRHQVATALSNALLVAGLNVSLAQVRAATAQLEEARAELQLMVRQLVSAEERERASLARDLHDDALQEVLYVIRHAQLCERLAAQIAERHQVAVPVIQAAEPGPRRHDTPLPDALQRLRQELRQLYGRATVSERKLRSVYLRLYPQLLQSLGLSVALEDLAEQVHGTTGLDIAVATSDETAVVAELLPAERAVHLYRIVQEALTNAARHSRARHVWVTLALASPLEGHYREWGTATYSLALEICDDGVGMPAPVNVGSLVRQGHFGLAGMRERAREVGGLLDVRRRVGGGTRVQLTVPVVVGDDPGATGL